jgi:hypothetical protein
LRETLYRVPSIQKLVCMSQHHFCFECRLCFGWLNGKKPSRDFFVLRMGTARGDAGCDEIQLFGAEGVDWVYGGGAARRDVAGQQRGGG